MFGFIWNLTQKLEWRRLVIATVMAVVGVHATYYNAVLLFAICAGGCFVALRERNWRTALAVNPVRRAISPTVSNPAARGSMPGTVGG